MPSISACPYLSQNLIMTLSPHYPPRVPQLPETLTTSCLFMISSPGLRTRQSDYRPTPPCPAPPYPALPRPLLPPCPVPCSLPAQEWVDYRNGSDSDNEGPGGFTPEDATEPRASSLAASILGAASPAGVVSAYSSEGGFLVRKILHAYPCPAVCAYPVPCQLVSAPFATARPPCAPVLWKTRMNK